MPKASLGFMRSYGFRARSQPRHHIAIIDFARSRMGPNLFLFAADPAGSDTLLFVHQRSFRPVLRLAGMQDGDGGHSDLW
jgi:hypothetical protein